MRVLLPAPRAIIARDRERQAQAQERAQRSSIATALPAPPRIAPTTVARSPEAVEKRRAARLFNKAMLERAAVAEPTAAPSGVAGASWRSWRRVRPAAASAS